METAARSMLTRVNNLREALDRSRLYDWAMRLPIVCYSSFVLARDIVGFWQESTQAPGLYAHPDAQLIIATLAQVSQWIFVALLAILPIFRWRPLVKSENLLARTGAFLTVLLVPAFMLLERAPPDLACNVIAVAASVAANLTAIVTLSFLGRSFSVMPEARRLVTTGPYALVRHPLYLCELLGVGAMVLQYRSLAAIGMLALIAALQFTRGRWEEAVLARAFPEFAAYQRRTPFLIPNYWRRLPLLFLSDDAIRRRSAAVVLRALALLGFASQVSPTRGD